MRHAKTGARRLVLFRPGRRSARASEDRVRPRLAERRPGRSVHRRRGRRRRAAARRPPAKSTTTRSGRRMARRSSSPPIATAPPISIASKPDGTGLERLTDNPAYDDQAAFSPDGKQLVFVTTRAGGTADLWTMDLQTRRGEGADVGARRRLPSGLVARRQVDRVLLRSRQHDADRPRPMGASAASRISTSIHPDGTG